MVCISYAYIFSNYWNYYWNSIWRLWYLTTAAIENNDPNYKETVRKIWDNMTGKRMFITGGVGAIADDEKFGPDYYLPTNAYLETCAAVGAGFFSQRMNQLTGQGKYMDEFERILYNSVLTGVSLSGDHYTYQNPLNAESNNRWDWNGCPCCPPMFLKIVSAIPNSIYSFRSNEIYINLFIGSEAKISLGNKQNVVVKQITQYPWDGKISVTVTPDKSSSEFSLKVRIPGWAVGSENSYGLYHSDLKTAIKLNINGIPVVVKPVDGYVTIKRRWNKGDKVELILPMEPRFVYANDAVKDLKGMITLASGPLVYCLEENLNEGLKNLKIDVHSPMAIKYNPNILKGVNIITGKAMLENSNRIVFKAIPYYAVGNIKRGNSYKVWISFQK